MLTLLPRPAAVPASRQRRSRARRLEDVMLDELAHGGPQNGQEASRPLERECPGLGRVVA
jgi:hypothetical protein